MNVEKNRVPVGSLIFVETPHNLPKIGWMFFAKFMF